PPREGDLQHLHQRRPLRPHGDDLPRDARAARPRQGRRALGGEGPLRGRAPGEGLRRGAPLRRALLQRVHAEAPEAAGARRHEARQAGLPRGRPAQDLRPRPRRLPADRRDREAHEGRDRRLRRGPRTGGGLMARLPGFAKLHPLAAETLSQGALQLMHELAQDLAEIAGMDAVSLQPAAGAQGEFAGVLMIRAYHLSHGEKRTKVLVPDSAHGTNPASTAIAGYEVVEVKSLPNGEVDVDALARTLDTDVAAFMITVPNTLGMFEPRIVEISELCHAKGVQVYMDGANLNAILGITRPGDLGF